MSLDVNLCPSCGRAMTLTSASIGPHSAIPIQDVASCEHWLCECGAFESREISDGIRASFAFVPLNIEPELDLEDD